MPGTAPADPRATAMFAIQVDRDARTSDFQISDSCATSYAHPPLSVGPYSDKMQPTLSVNNYSRPVEMHLPPMAIVPGLSATGSGISPPMAKLHEDRHTPSISNQSELCTLLYLSSHLPPHPLYCSPVAFFDDILPYHQNIATEPGIQFYGIGLALGGALYIFSLLLMALLGAKRCKPTSCTSSAGYGNVPVITVTPPLDEPALQEATVPGKDMICVDEMTKVEPPHIRTILRSLVPFFILNTAHEPSTEDDIHETAMLSPTWKTSVIDVSTDMLSLEDILEDALYDYQQFDALD